VTESHHSFIKGKHVEKNELEDRLKKGVGKPGEAYV